MPYVQDTQLIKEPMIGLTEAARNEIKRLMTVYPNGYFRVRNLTQEDKSWWEFSWDDATDDDFGVDYGDGLVIIADSITMAYMLNLFTVDWNGAEFRVVGKPSSHNEVDEI